MLLKFSVVSIVGTLLYQICIVQANTQTPTGPLGGKNRSKLKKYIIFVGLHKEN